MADVYTRIGYIKGATGAQGERGLQGDPGDAATIQVGTVTTVPYGQTANVVNSGTESAAVFDFTIPQGRPGQETTDMQNLVLGSITTSAASFPIPAVGETGKVIFGKITKWFSDMSALVATKLNIDHVVNNLTTTDSGYALDARQGKALKDMMDNFGIKVTDYPIAGGVQVNANVRGNIIYVVPPETGTYLVFGALNTQSDSILLKEVRLYWEPTAAPYISQKPLSPSWNGCFPIALTGGNRLFLQAIPNANVTFARDATLNVLKLVRIA